MQVIATAVGFDGLTVRQAGDKFTCPKNAKGEWIIGNKPDGTPKASWYKRVEEPAKDAKGAKNDGKDLA